MNFIPFPQEIAAPFSQRISAEYRESVERNRRAGRVIHEDKTLVDWLGYRMPDGTCRIVYSPYKPEYPEGAEPGLVNCQQVAKYYPNSTRGYEFHAFDFRPLEQAL